MWCSVNVNLVRMSCMTEKSSVFSPLRDGDSDAYTDSGKYTAAARKTQSPMIAREEPGATSADVHRRAQSSTFVEVRDTLQF